MRVTRNKAVTGIGCDMGKAIRAALLLTLLVGVASADAQSTGGPYTVRKQAIASGGNRASAGPYVATVTIAEPTASAAQSGGTYRLTGGFHGPRGPSAPLPERIFCDGFEAAPCT